MRYAMIQAGVVIRPRTLSEAEPGSTQVPDYVLEGDTTLDNGVTFYRDGKLVVPQLVPVTKLSIKSRVTSAEWSALKAAIATDPDADENWELANTIDPEHPQTKAVIAYLQSQNALTTPLWQIFAQSEQ